MAVTPALAATLAATLARRGVEKGFAKGSTLLPTKIEHGAGRRVVSASFSSSSSSKQQNQNQNQNWDQQQDHPPQEERTGPSIDIGGEPINSILDSVLESGRRSRTRIDTGSQVEVKPSTNEIAEGNTLDTQNEGAANSIEDGGIAGESSGIETDLGWSWADLIPDFDLS